jgi:hypothetical protein
MELPNARCCAANQSFCFWPAGLAAPVRSNEGASQEEGAEAIGASVGLCWPCGCKLLSGLTTSSCRTQLLRLRCSRLRAPDPLSNMLTL